jgi:hypothetical protein
MDTDQAASCLLDCTKAMDNQDGQTNKGLDIPKRTDGSEYIIDDLADDQNKHWQLLLNILRITVKANSEKKRKRCG